LSTLSQLGIMVVRVSLGYLELAYFHLVIHAIFKALLFLCGGKIIHLMGGYQDIRFMGGISFRIIGRITCLNISNFSLCGIPFLSGYYSRDLIFEGFGVLNINLVRLGLIFCCGIFSIIYRLRFWWVRRFLYYNGSDYYWDDRAFYRIFPEVVLAVFGVWSGSLIFWLGLPEVEEILVFGYDKVWLIFIITLRMLIGIIVVLVFINYFCSEVIYLIIYVFDLRSLASWFPFFFSKMMWTFDLGWGEIVGAYGVTKIIGGIPGVFITYQNKNFLLLLIVFIRRILVLYSLVY